MNIIGAIITIILIALIVSPSRKLAIVGMMGGVLYLTTKQALEIVGFNIFALRLLELAGLMRVITRREVHELKLNRTDYVLLLLYAYSTVIFLIRSSTGQAYVIGMMVDASLCYFIFRALIVNTDDFKWFLGVFVYLLIPYAVFVAIEMLTKNNPFSIIGGTTFVLREGRLRCMGSFRHSSLLGTLGASFLPIYVSLIFNEATRKTALMGIFLSLAIIYLSNSGGPLSAAAVGMVGWGLWFFRSKLRLIRYCVLGLVIVVGSIMKAPIWYLPARVSSIVGGDGWHRSYLMDVAFGNFDRWWLAGMDLMETTDWFEYLAPATGTADITNQYIAFGLDAGVLAIVLFISLIATAFYQIGQAFAKFRAHEKPPTETEYMLWGLGCAVLVHIFTWLGITYTFDQTYVIWFLHLAAISSLTQYYLGIADAGIPQQREVKPVKIMQHRYKTIKANKSGR